MKTAASALLIVALASGQAPPPNRPPVVHRALQRLQGTWQFESMVQDGRAVAADELKGRTLFVGGDVFLIRDGDKILYSGQIGVDPNKSPASFTVSVRDGQKSVEALLGIYQVLGDTLKLAFVAAGEPRPAEFASEPGSNVRSVVCKSIRGPGEDVELVGTYRAESVGTDGKTQVLQAQIQKQGDSYVVVYHNNAAVLYVGVGIRQGDTFSLAWGRQNQIGVCQYKIERGPKLVGRYTIFGGPGVVLPEVMTRIPNVD
jgi:uncharacterized protein (TIGR03067 family)